MSEALRPRVTLTVPVTREVTSTSTHVPWVVGGEFTTGEPWTGAFASVIVVSPHVVSATAWTATPTGLVECA